MKARYFSFSVFHVKLVAVQIYTYSHVVLKQGWILSIDSLLAFVILIVIYEW